MTHVTAQSIAEFKIEYLQFLNEQSEPTQSLPALVDKDTLIYLYEQMSLVRAFDTKAVNLQRTGKLGTFPSSQGQEAIGVGIGHAMQADDIFCPYYRDQGTAIQRGVTLSEILLYWGGDERGSHFKNPAIKSDFPICVPIAGQCLHAAGIAYALQYREKPNAVVTVLGDGGTSKGDFYESINLAGVWTLPLVIVVNNNQWAISVPRDKQTHCQTVAQKAIAAGIRGLQVDGNDVIAVDYAVSEALNQARKGNGPTLIEAITYRLCDHTTADNAARYRSQEEHDQAWKREPIARLRKYLEKKQWWSDEQEQTLQQKIMEQIDAAVEEYLNVPAPATTDMIDYLYAELPESLQAQREEIRELK